MENRSLKNSFVEIFKSTALFAFVQVFRSVIGMIKNKVIAVLLGAEGIGLIGIYDSIILFMQTLAGLGLKQSAVKDIAEVNDKVETFSRVICVVNKVILITAVLGGLINLLGYSIIGKLTLGEGQHLQVFALLSIVVMLNIVNEGKLTILKGMRRLRLLAYANMIGVIVAFVVSVPLYFYYGEKGILPVFVISSGIGLLVSSWFVRKIPYERVKLSLKDIITESTPMIRMGGVLMLVAFLDTAVTLIIASYIRSKGGFADLGFFNAGKIILSSYFGILITALSTDYYPRIAEVNNNNEQLKNELNKQSLMSIVLCGPLFVLFLFLLPFFIELLYTSEFLPTVEFIRYGIYGTLITICSNQVDLILVAKQKVKVFASINIIYRSLQLILSIYFYSIWGLTGLGITVVLISLFHLLVMSITVYMLYGIKFSKQFNLIALIVLIFAFTSSYISELPNELLRFLLGIIVMLCSVVFTGIVFQKLFGISLVGFIKKRF